MTRAGNREDHGLVRLCEHREAVWGSPHSVTIAEPSRAGDLTAEDRRFLETSLADLSAPTCALDSSAREEIQSVVHAALGGSQPVVQAAEALVTGMRRVCLERLQRGFMDETGKKTPVIESVTTRPLKEMSELPGAIQQFLDDYPETDWEIAEVVTRGDPTRSQRLLGFHGRVISGSPLNLMGIDHLYGKGEVFRWMHPAGSRLVRHLPLQFLLWDEVKRSGDGGVGVQFTAQLISLDEIHDLLARRARPVLVKIPEARADDSSFGSSRLHGGVYDELKAYYHDIYHLRRWNQFPPDLRWSLQRNAMTLHDAVRRALQAQPPEVQAHKVIADACDEWLSGPNSYRVLLDPYGSLFGAMDVYFCQLPFDSRNRIWEAIQRHSLGEGPE